ncbi:uncharacterized protein ARMOST_03183 [Armillaria ostoyae]|uniref:Uncharacterized protein n=1 Tax=Armillaria ostoyae TaxID=47428 RepID=A0A284QTS0_ARMOS|nr:uncharacterized protein ARMOST_03183 [Armillaria ostoyae]
MSESLEQLRHAKREVQHTYKR